MIDLSHLITHIQNETGLEVVEDTYLIPNEDVVTTTPSKVYVDYQGIVSPMEEVVTLDSASQVGALVTLFVVITLDAPKSAYPNVLLDLYKACQHYEPESPIKSQIRVLSFFNGDFLTSGQRRIFKSIWAVTFDRFIR